MPAEPHDRDEPRDPGDTPDARSEEEILAEMERNLQEADIFTAPPAPGPMPEVLRNPPPTPPSPYSIPETRDKYPDQTRAILGRVGAIGTEFVLSVLALGLVGWGADWLLGTKPWLLLAGVVLGLVYGFIKFVREATAASRSASQRRP